MFLLEPKDSKYEQVLCPAMLPTMYDEQAAIRLRGDQAFGTQESSHVMPIRNAQQQLERNSFVENRYLCLETQRCQYNNCTVVQ